MVSNARQLAQVPSAPSGRRNLIINGAMGVHQRGGTISAVNAATYTLDRYITIRGGSYNYDVDISQSSEAPDGFVNSLKIDVQATSTPSTSDNFGIEQKIESQNTTHLNYGSSSGKYIVLSFWVRSNKTGTYGFQILHQGKTRNFISSYTINSADTWENKTILINPDTSGSAFDDDNADGLRVIWHLSTGSDDLLSGNRDWTADGSFRSVTGQVNLLDSTSNEFYITGVQLEVGTVPTDFEHRSYSGELQLCRRYYQKYSFPDGTAVVTAANWNGVSSYGAFSFDVEMRVVPTTFNQGSASLFRRYQANTNDVTTAIDVRAPSKHGCEVKYEHTSDTTGQAGWLRSDSNSAYFEFDADL